MEHGARQFKDILPFPLMYRILTRNRLYMYILFFLPSSIAGFIHVHHSFYLNLQGVDAFLILCYIHFYFLLFSRVVVALYPWTFEYID